MVVCLWDDLLYFLIIIFKKKIYEQVKKLAFKYTNVLKPRYPYFLGPIQLSFLINFLELNKELDGHFLEVGVDKGMTTRFICEHIIKSKLNIEYFVVDTFSSFTDEDINFEIENRGKQKGDSNFLNFKYNDYERWASNFRNMDFLTAFKCDCSQFDYKVLGKLKLVLLDVDLYLPTLRALEKIYEQLEVGGCIMVDNVSTTKSIYDGAHQAYYEFCEKNNIAIELVGNNSGIIYKRN